jgi:phage baseplate assembly protein gpV
VIFRKDKGLDKQEVKNCAANDNIPAPETSESKKELELGQEKVVIKHGKTTIEAPAPSSETRDTIYKVILGGVMTGAGVILGSKIIKK